ncbi:MAG: hypothetical protein JWP75_3751 [Frondihabitans sp.]|nr:hypothetical protein [Frondihabitans sp.]
MRDNPVVLDSIRIQPMTAGTLTTKLPALVIDPTDYLVVDIATGRHVPGDAIHAAQLAQEHDLTATEALEAIEGAWHLGLLSFLPDATSGIVVWTPQVTQRQVHRLARAMATTVATGGLTPAGAPDLIDGEGSRFGAVELFGLSAPCDVDLFLELARALLSRSAPHLVDELVAPIAVLYSDEAQAVHAIEFAAPAVVRQEIVAEMVRSLMDGRSDDFADHLADYVVALAVE